MINDNTDLSKYYTTETKVSCLPSSLMLIAFHTSLTLLTKGHSGSEKKLYINFKLQIQTFQSLYFNQRISFDTKGPISHSSEENSLVVVIFDTFTQYVTLNFVPHCKTYYANTTLYEQWMAKFGLKKILVTAMEQNSSKIKSQHLATFLK